MFIFLSGILTFIHRAALEMMNLEGWIIKILLNLSFKVQYKILIVPYGIHTFYFDLGMKANALPGTCTPCLGVIETCFKTDSEHTVCHAGQMNMSALLDKCVSKE